MKSLLSLLTVFLLVMLPFAAMAQDATQKADHILTNGKFYTVEAQAPNAEAVAIRNGRFLAVGSLDEVSVHKGDDTTMIDLEGKFVMPGFIDAHTHPIRSQLFIDVDLELPVDRATSP